MAWQLVYTSAPALLEAGRTGFGTVAKHEAIRPTLQTELERISQFSREQGLSKNRILFYHRALDLRGERYHVLTRIKDAGSDYTGRTNHIAHHIVLTASEADQAYRATRCTPADMILWITSNGLWRDQWNEAARLFDVSEQLSVGEVPSRLNLPAFTWAAVTGASTNAAILAPGGAATEGCWLLYRGDQASQILPLIGESLCLHPNPWSVSFSTDTQPTDRIEEIQWRGVDLGSPLEREARQSVRPILDLGNPASLPSPVESATHLAKTGLLQAPPPAIASRKLISAGCDFKGHSSATTSALFKGNAQGTVSLKEKMKRQAASSKSANERSPLLKTIAIGIVSALAILLVAIVWNEFLIEEKGINVLAQKANIISNKLTESKQVGVDDLKKKIISSNHLTGPFIGYYIGQFGIKSNFSDADTALAKLQNEKDLWKEINERRSNSPSEPLLSLYSEIIQKKESYDASRPVVKAISTPSPTPTPAKPKSEQIISLKIAGNSLSSGQSITATNGQKLPLEAISSSGVQVSVTASGAGSVTENKTLTINEMGSITLKLSALGNERANGAETNIQIVFIPPAARITKIEFFDNSKDAWNYFFAGVSTNTNGVLLEWSYCQTNGLATNMLALLAVPFTAAQSYNNIPAWNTNSFNENATNAGSCFFRKDNSTQEITLTVTPDKNKPITNILDISPIVITQTGERYTCTLATLISPLLELLKVGKYSVEYNISTEPEIKGDSLENLAQNINAKIENYNKHISLAEVALNQEKDRRSQVAATNSQTFKKETATNQKYPDLENAGEVLSQELKFISSQAGKPNGFPEDLKKYSVWLQANKQDRSKVSYTNYLKAVLNKIKECENGLTFPTDTYISETSKIEDIGVNKKPETPTEGKKKKNDEAFIANFKRLFTPDWPKNLEQFLASTAQPKATPTPDVAQLTKKLSDGRKELEKYIESIRKSPQKISVLGSGNKPILIFTSP